MLLRSQQYQVNSSLCSSGTGRCRLQCTSAARLQGAHLKTNMRAITSRAAYNSGNRAASWAAGPASSSSSASSSSRSLARSAGVICRDAPRPMWAAKTPKDDRPKAAGGDVARMITKDLTKCDSLAALSDVYNEWGGSFNYVHASTAITKYAKLKRGKGTEQLLPRLLRCWLQQLPDASDRECANVLWALGKFGTGLDEVWEPTFEAFLRLVEQDAKTQSISPQHISNSLLACARLRKQPAPGQLQLLMRALLLPDVLAAATEQSVSNTVWALGKLCRLEGWQGGVSEEDIQQLLGPQQLQLLSATGTQQAISNVLLGLADMSMAEPPVVSKVFAQQCSRQLLAGTGQRLVTGNAQTVCNTMYACSELGLADAAFVEAAAAKAASWVPNSLDMAVRQAATACAKLQFRHQGLMVALLKRGQQLLQPSGAQGRQQRTLHSRVLGPVDKDQTVALLCSAVAYLDMPQLAPQALQLVEDLGISQRPDTHKTNVHRLWLFHSWLLQHQLANGQGLTGLLTQQQMQRGQHEAAQYPDYV